MKKLFKRVLALALATALLCGLSGCAALDELRKCQVFYDTQGNLVCDGVTYKLLPTSDYFFPEVDYNTQLFLTESDVPVLLSIFLANGMLYGSEDGNIIISGEDYYCKEDKYDEISQRLSEEFDPAIVCYYYDAYEEDGWELERKSYTLTQQQVDAMELVVTTVEPVSYNQTGMYPDHDYALDIYECSADMLLRSCTTQLIVGSERYYLAVYTDADTLIFTVPDGCNDTFDKIVSAYESANQWLTEEDMTV